MSFLTEKQRKLITAALLKRISLEDFCKEFPLTPEDGSHEALKMLERALVEHDADAVEDGLDLAVLFGVSDVFLDVLLPLAEQSWHKWHEDIVTILDALRSVRSVPVLARTASRKLAYRTYDEANSLGVKCIWALGAIECVDALEALGELMLSGDSILEEEAQAQLGRAEREWSSPALRAEAKLVRLKAEGRQLGRG